MKHNYNSLINQDIKSTLVGRYVHYQINQVVEDLTHAHHLDTDIGFDMIEHMGEPKAHFEGDELTQEEAEELQSKLNDELETLEDNVSKLNDELFEIEYLEETKQEDIDSMNKELDKAQDLFNTMQDRIDELDTLDYDIYPEPLEYWLLDDWFSNKLEQNGELIIKECGLTIWARCTSGQAILLDYCISLVAEDMQILEGMQNSWERKEAATC